MIPAKEFWAALRARDFNFFSGVPCSILTEALAAVPDVPGIQYVPAVREDLALGVASGGYFAGKRTGILIQNSGLGNIINGLTSYSLMYEVPILMFITWRGYQGKDAPEHILMGDKMLDILELIGVPHRLLEDDNFETSLDEATEYMDREQRPFAIIVRKGAIG
ncbi:MAG: thiamine pyrophosphate-binding protein [Planctomycetota bacterium]|nr:thiamine pyrophosphate-binding protein [Planctomycetota bacterium]MDA1138144.1 thiamine pyrophosphate-binding protein [Planctomycetota bacterium]